MTTARCPNNDAHDRFRTVAHVTEDWEVDKHGDFVRVLDTGEVVHPPSVDNIWNCLECGAEADIDDD